MNKGLIRAVFLLVFLLLPLAALSEGEIYKVVDKDGNITFTDQRPTSGAKPVDLPPLSVIETEPIAAPAAGATDPAADEPEAPTLRQLRKQFSDFKINSPQAEETFWGTANMVMVSWGGSEPVLEDMKVVLYVDGSRKEVLPSGSTTIQFDRGEHSVYAELLDYRSRKIITTETVTFFVKQHSVGQNVRVNRPRQGN
jgi:hypothetical protein